MNILGWRGNMLGSKVNWFVLWHRATWLVCFAYPDGGHLSLTPSAEEAQEILSMHNLLEVFGLE